MPSRTDALEFSKVCAANSTASSFASKVPTTTEPTGDGVVSPLRSGGVYDNVLLAFYGTGNDDTTFDARVIGWRKISTLWVPVPLFQLTATLSTAVGVSGAAVTDSERFADTLALSADFTGADGVSVQVQSLSGLTNKVAHLVFDAKGFTKFEVLFDLTGATAANALWAGY
jgi:hypothetical protein